jgi:hypothetical protein
MDSIHKPEASSSETPKEKPTAGTALRDGYFKTDIDKKLLENDYFMLGVMAQCSMQSEREPYLRNVQLIYKGWCPY